MHWAKAAYRQSPTAPHHHDRSASAPLHRKFTVNRMVVSTYVQVRPAAWQATRACGTRGQSSRRPGLENGRPSPSFFKSPSRFNFFIHNSDIVGRQCIQPVSKLNGRTSRTMIWTGSRRLLDLRDRVLFQSSAPSLEHQHHSSHAPDSRSRARESCSRKAVPCVTISTTATPQRVSPRPLASSQQGHV